MANEPLDEFDRRLKAKKEYANYGFIADIDSGLSPAETLGYYDLQKMSDDEYNKFSQAVKSNSSPTIDTSSIINDDKPGIGTAVMNGLKGSVRGLFGAAKAAIDSNIEAHKGDKNVVKEYDQSENISKALGYVTDEILKREEVKADTAAGQLGYDLAENAIQLLAQLALTKGVGAAGAGAKTVHAISMLYNGANISGEQYLRLRKEGVNASRAAEAGLMNAIPQAVLEELPLGRLLKKMPAGSGLKAKIWEVTKRGLEEGVTEALQEFPEQATDLWAKNPGASTAKLAEKWGENWQQNLKEAGYSGLIGAILGGTASGAKVAVDSVVEHVALKANEERKAKLVADAERIKETGINPERAAATIEANNPNFEDDTVTVSAQDLEGYKQTSSNNKLFEELGITEEEVEAAAELGQDIDISRGKFTAAMAKDTALFEATKDNMYFDSNGELSDGGAKTRKELREGYNLTRQASTELDAELDAIVDSATKAGMNKSHAGNLRLVLESRALIADPENPAAWLQKNKLRFEDGGKAKQKNGWFSKGGVLKKEQFYTTNITGNEMGHYSDLKSLQKKAFAWYRDNLQGTSVHNGVLGDIRIDKGYQENNIKFGASGRKKMEHTSAKKEKLFALRYLREIMENGNFVTESAPQKEKHSDENFYYIHSALNVNGEKRYVVVTVREHNDKSLSYYNHNVFNESEYKKIEDAFKPSGSEQFKAQPSISNKTSSFADSVSQKADNYKQQKIVNGTLKDKGMFSPAEDGSYIITLFKGADASTVIHETGHYFAETMINEALADPSNARLNADAKKLMEYAGIDAETWASGDVEAKRAGHEKLAEAFETYIMEGKAPSVGLRGVFQRFANWLSAIYSKIARSDNAAELTPEVRQVFDRMLACREEIEVMARMEGMFGGLPENITSKLSDQNKKALQDKILKAKDKAVDILTRRAMADFSAKRRAEKAAFIEEIRPQIEEAVALELVNRARHQVGYEFGKEVKAVDSHFIDDEHGMAHANNSDTLWRKTKPANPAIIARKYRHVLGSVLPNYNDMLNDTNASIDDILNPIVEYLQAEVDTYGTLSKERVANAEDIADYYDLRSTGLDYSDAEIKADFKHIVDELDRLQTLKHRLETDPEGVDLVKESKRNQLSQEQKELFDQIAEENGYASGYEMAREIVEGYTVNENEGSDVQDNWARNYIRNGGDRAKLKSEEGLKEIAETLVEGEQLTELNELKALKHELETNPDKVDLVEMSKKRSLSNEQRELFDWVADSLGYDSGDAMAQDILTSPSERAMVRQEIDKAVNRRFPDFMQEREQAREAAREALYNDESGEVVALEQQLIDEALNEISDKDIKQKERENIAKVRKQNADNFAKRYIQTLPAGEVMKPRRFAMAERRAAANANKAAKAGLLEEAAMYKQQQMINHALYREAVKAKHQIESARKYVKKQMHSKKEVWGTEQHFFQMCALLERMGYHRKDFNTNGREVQPLSDYIAEMQAKYGDKIISMPEFVLNPNNDLTNAPQLSLANYMDVIDALKNIRAIAKQDTQMNKIAAGEAFEQVKADTIAHLQELPVEYEAEIGSDSKKSLRKRIVEWPKNIIATLRNADNFFLMMDNWTEEGYFTREFYNKINHCADMESEMLESYQNELIDALQKWEPDKKTGIAHDTRIYYKELGGSADKHALIAMLCNLGSDSNAARLCSQKPVGVKNSDIWVEESELIGREEAMLQTKQNLIEFLCKHLTKEDIAYAQARINAASKFWPMLAEVNRKTKGFEPPKIEASPLVLKLASGESVVFDGGYFPLERDTRTGSMPRKFDRIDSTEEGNRPPQRTLTTNTGSSKSRTGGKYPVDLSRGSEVTAVKSTIHDICYRETMLDFRKILNDEDIYRNMVERLGDTNVRLLREFLQACANPYGNKTAYMAEKTFTKIANALRNATINIAIMFNFKAAMQNTTNIFLYGNSTEGFTHADAFRALLRSFTGEGRAEVDAICAKSAFMRERSQAPDITLRDIQKRSDLDPIEKKTLKYGALLLGYTDMMTAKPVFAEAYMKKINEGKTEQEALDFANTVIRRTLGSSRIHDVSSLQRSSGLFRVFTMFQGFFNTQFNQWDREAHIVKRLWNSGEKKEMAERLIAFVGAKFLSVCFLNVAIAELSLTAPFEKDEDGYRKLSKELINYPLSMGGPVVQAANVGVQTLLGMRNYGYRLTAVQGLMDKGFTVIRRAGKVARGEEGPGELAEQAAYVFGAWRGVPAGIVNILFNSLDIAEDNMDFELQDLIKRRPRSERKHEQ